MTSPIPYLDASSKPIGSSKGTFGEATRAASGYTPVVLRFDRPVFRSDAAIQHSAFDEFMASLEADPSHASGIKEARAWVAEALYSEEEVTPKVLRLRAGLTQTQLAAILETSQPQIVKIESGRHDPSISTCRKLCKALGVSLDVLSAALENQATYAQQKGSK